MEDERYLYGKCEGRERDMRWEEGIGEAIVIGRSSCT